MTNLVVRDLTKKNNFSLSQKYIDFINSTKNVDADFLEGTTASGKTTVGAGVKFMLMVSKNKKKLHIIASKTTGTAEKNIIQQDNGILDIYKEKSTTLSWFIGLLVGAFVSFFFYVVQAKLIK